MERESQPAGMAQGRWSGRRRRTHWTIFPVATTLAAAMLVLLPVAPVQAVGAGAAASPANTTGSAELEPPSAGETLLLALINQARAAEGLPPVTWDPALSRVAWAHARDMIQNGYFGHISPTDGTPAGRTHRAGIKFIRLGENLAGNTDLADAHRMLMASPTHRANILDPGYRRVGIAVVHGGPYGYMIVEMFIATPEQPEEPVIASASPTTAGDAR